MSQPGTTAPPAQTPAASAGGAFKPARRRRWLALAVALVLVAAGLILRHFRSGAVPESVTCPTSAETTAVSCELPGVGAVTPEPFPAQAQAQVDWVLRYHRPAMVLFYSTLCRPCMMMDSLVQLVRRDYEPDVTFIEVLGDSPANAALVHHMNVGTVPCSFFFTASGESKRIVGLMKQQDLRAELAALVASAQSAATTAP